MRSSVITCVLGIAALVSQCGCVSFSSVTYPNRASTHPPENLRIHADDKRELSVALVLHTTNFQSVAVLPEASSVTDGQGRHYMLQFRKSERSGYTVGDWYWSWYRVQAYSPAPSRSQLVFSKGSYTIS